MGASASEGLSSAVQAATPQQLKETLAGISIEDQTKIVNSLPSDSAAHVMVVGRSTSKTRAAPRKSPANRSREDIAELTGHSVLNQKRQATKGQVEDILELTGGLPGTPAGRRNAGAGPSLSSPKTIAEKIALSQKKIDLSGRTIRSLVRSPYTLYELWSGGKFDDSFDTKNVIGEGGFGQVVLVTNKADGTERAVKTMLKGTDKDVNAMQLNEVQTLISLDHPHIVKLFRYYESDTDIKLVFELCRGPDLLEKIINGPMSERNAAVAVRHMLKALKYCHEMYFGHYDVKPENFMYSGFSETNLKMIDFGFSGGFMRGDGKIRGTISYMAPEVVRGTLGPEADVWSCGAVLFAMLTTWEFTDLDPEGDSSDLMKILKVRFKDRRWAQERLQEAADEKKFPATVRDLLAKMLTHDRHMRPSVHEALSHPFVKDTYNTPVHDDAIEAQAETVLNCLVESLRAFAKQPMLKRSALLVLSHRVCCGDGTAKAQRVAYRKLDKTGSGDLSVDSLESAMVMNKIPIPDDLDDLFTYIDTDCDGYVCFVDFLAATLPPSIVRDQGNLESVFGVLDYNRDGVIDACDLVKAFGNDADDADATSLCSNAISEAGFSSNFFCCEEFINFMRDKL